MPVLGKGVDLPQTVEVLGCLGKLPAEALETHIVYLSEQAHIPTAEVAHVVVDEEVVRLHVVRPTVALVVPPAEPFAVHHKPADEKLFHRACVDIIHAVKLHVALQDGAHRLAELLFVAVAGRTGRLLALAPVHAQHGTHEPADDVVLQGHVPLALDILFLAHRLPVNGYRVVPLVAVGVTFVPLPLLAETPHVVPCRLRFHEHIESVAATGLPPFFHAVHPLLGDNTAKGYKSFCHIIITKQDSLAQRYHLVPTILFYPFTARWLVEHLPPLYESPKWRLQAPCVSRHLERLLRPDRFCRCSTCSLSESDSVRIPAS